MCHSVLTFSSICVIFSTILQPLHLGTVQNIHATRKYSVKYTELRNLECMSVWSGVG